MIQSYLRWRDPWPAKLRLLKRLRKKADPAAVPPHDLHTVGSLGTEHIKCPIEWVDATVPHQTINDIGPLRKSTGMLAT